MSTDDRFLRFENAMATLAELSANQEERIARLEASTAQLQESTTRLQDSTARLQDSFLMLVDLAGRHDERLDELRTAQADSERKIAALAEAHIRTEVALAHLTAKVDVLVDIIQGGANGRSS